MGEDEEEPSVLELQRFHQRLGGFVSLSLSHQQRREITCWKRQVRRARRSEVRDGEGRGESPLHLEEEQLYAGQ